MQFLSSEWFTKVSELRTAAGPMELPAQIKDSVINVTLTDIDDGKKIHIAAGEFVEEHKLARNIYNTYDWGGYMAFKLFPDYLMFWDGRQDSAEMDAAKVPLRHENASRTETELRIIRNCA